MFISLLSRIPFVHMLLSLHTYGDGTQTSLRQTDELHGLLHLQGFLPQGKQNPNDSEFRI